MTEYTNSSSASFCATGLRLENVGGRLVVRSGPPRFVEVILVAAAPSLVLLAPILRLRRWEPEAGMALLASFAFSLILWVGAGGWTLVLDRREGRARLRRGPLRTRRALAEFVGIRLSSMLQAQIEDVRRRRTVMPFAPVADIGCSVALVDTSGRWWRVSRSQDRSGCTPRREDAERAARMVADYLGIPFLPPYETPPGGAVPPALDDCTVLRRPG